MASRLRFALPILLAAFAAAGPAAAADPFSADQKAALEKLLHDYLIEHPEVLVESLTAYQRRQQAEEDRQAQQALVAARDALERAPGDLVLGNPDGDVTVVEFFDYQCGYCKQMLKPMQALIARDGKLRVVMKEFPILGPESVVAAKAAMAADRQGKYAAFHLATLGLKGRLTAEAIDQVAREVGLDMARLKADMQDPAIDERIARNKALADDLRIQGTPAFAVGGQLIPGAVSQEALADLIKHLRGS